jgi:hypothetical protein
MKAHVEKVSKLRKAYLVQELGLDTNHWDTKGCFADLTDCDWEGILKNQVVFNKIALEFSSKKAGVSFKITHCFCLGCK